MHVNNNFCYIVLGNQSRNSGPIFNRLDIFINRFQFPILQKETERDKKKRQEKTERDRKRQKETERDRL